MSSNPNAPLQKSNTSHLTRSSWIKIIVILIVSIVIFANMWSCMSDSTTHHSTRNNSVERAATPIPITSDEDGSTTTLDPATFADSMNTPYDQADASWVLPADSLKDINVTWASGTLNIHPLPDSAGNNIIALYTSSDGDLENAPRIALDNGVLNVDPVNTPISFIPFVFGNLAETSLEIGIPESIASSLECVNLDSASGVMTISNLTANEAQFAVASGNLDLDSLNANQLKIDMASGVVAFDGEAANSLNLSVASGTLEAKSTLCPRSLDIDLISGRIDLALPKDTALNVDLDKVSGSFNNYLPTSSSNAASSAHADIDITSGSMVIKALEEA